jgi:hypothetical protein
LIVNVMFGWLSYFLEFLDRWGPPAGYFVSAASFDSLDSNESNPAFSADSSPAVNTWRLCISPTAARRRTVCCFFPLSVNEYLRNGAFFRFEHRYEPIAGASMSTLGVGAAHGTKIRDLIERD